MEAKNLPHGRTLMTIFYNYPQPMLHVRLSTSLLNLPASSDEASIFIFFISRTITRRIPIPMVRVLRGDHVMKSIKILQTVPTQKNDNPSYRACPTPPSTTGSLSVNLTRDSDFKSNQSSPTVFH